MSVLIKVVGPEDNHEYQFALSLKSILEEGLPNNANGNICIASSVQLFGQSIRDIDLVVFGALENTSLEIHASSYESPDVYKKRQVWLNSFCFTIETKEHESQNIELRGTSLVVKYGNGKLRDATLQSEDQKYSLLNYLNSHAPNVSVWICNFVWMLNLNSFSLNKMMGSRPHNILPNLFTLSDILQRASIQSKPRELKDGNHCSISNLYSKSGGSQFDVYLTIENLLTAPRQAIGSLSRKSVERIVGREIKITKELMNNIGEKLVILSGRAGTGKTVKLLRIGCSLASDKGDQCLFLTYNRALVNDIRRTLYFADIPSDFDSGCIKIMTIHEFTYKIGVALGLVNGIDDSVQSHVGLCTEIVKYIEAEVITEDDIINLMNERHELACWDHVLVDEVQDFCIEEKKFLYKFFWLFKINNC